MKEIQENANRINFAVDQLAAPDLGTPYNRHERSSVGKYVSALTVYYVLSI